MITCPNEEQRNLNIVPRNIERYSERSTYDSQDRKIEVNVMDILFH